MTKKFIVPNFNVEPNEIKLDILNIINELKEEYLKLETIKRPKISDLDVIEQKENKLSEKFNILSYLISLKNDPELEKIEEELIKPYSELSSFINFNKNIYNFYVALSKTQLNSTQQYVIDKTVQSFELSGLSLPKEKQEELQKINEELSSLCNKYSINVKNSKDKSFIIVKNDEKDKLLSGVRDVDLERFKNNAINAGIDDSYLITILPQDLNSILQDCSNREMRKSLFLKNAFVATKELNDINFDNTNIVKKILHLREEKAKLLGFNNFAELSLSRKLAKDPNKVFDLLNSIKEKVTPLAQKEVNQLKEYSKTYIDGEFQAWDFSYVSNKYQKEFFDVNIEEIKEYFNLEKSLLGLSQLIKELFNYDLKEVPIEKESIISEYSRKFAITKEDQTIAFVYCDFIARKGKQGGAWMNDFSDKTENQLPVAFVTCNFEAPVDGVTRMSIGDIETLFHEFGHALHHTLTDVVESGASGLSGVPWDAVEVPSTFMEFFCLDQNLIKLMSFHKKTGAVIPDSLLEKIKNSSSYLAAQQLLRQVEFSLMDMIIHTEHGADPKVVFDKLKDESNLYPKIEGTNFCNQFGHLFGGYAAGYYSYLWSEIYASNIFDSFDNNSDNNFINSELGNKYLKTILSKGGSKDFHSLFIDFKGKELNTDALFKYRNISMDKPVVSIAKKYLKLLSNVESVNNFDDYASPSHLKWMLEVISKDEMEETKANRWLGFIQAHLGIQGIIDIKTERDSTRAVFNGK